jgi:hypothetical protein
MASTENTETTAKTETTEKPPDRTVDEVQREIEQEREQLVDAVASLRNDLHEAAAVKRREAIKVAGVVVVVAGTVKVVTLVVRRRRAKASAAKRGRLIAMRLITAALLKRALRAR